MDMVRMYHPVLDRVEEIPESAAGQHAMAGWVPAPEGDEPPKCPTCGQNWPPPDPPPPADQQDQAPESSGASSSPQPSPSPRRRRTTSEERG